MGLIINRKDKWGYIHIPKTGGTSLTEILMNVDGSEELTSHGTLNELNNVDDYFIFTFVRNPYNRIASWYEHRQRDTKSQSFPNFLKSISELDYLYHSQTYFIKHGETENKSVSFIGRYENYITDLNYILNQIGVVCTDIPHLNKNPMWNRHPNLNTDKLYKLYYKNESEKNWVKEKYKDDFKLFNYELDI